MDEGAPFQGYFMWCIIAIEAALQVEVHHYKGIMSVMYNRALLVEEHHYKVYDVCDVK